MCSRLVEMPPPASALPLFLFLYKSRVSLHLVYCTVNTIVTNVLEEPNVPTSNYLSDCKQSYPTRQ
jgi:hypothetical protein